MFLTERGWGHTYTYHMSYHWEGVGPHFPSVSPVAAERTVTVEVGAVTGEVEGCWSPWVELGRLPV